MRLLCLAIPLALLSGCKVKDPPPIREVWTDDFEREDISTVGGLVYEAFGRAPRQGESVNCAGYRLTVDRVERRRVQRVLFERVDSKSGHAA